MDVDKEQLYEDALALKHALHSTKAESVLLKSKIQHHEHEKLKKDKAIKELLERLRNPYAPLQSVKMKTHLLPALKTKLREAKQENLTLRKELRKLQKDDRFTKLNELEAESKIYADEFARLTGMLDIIEDKSKFIPPEDAAVIENRVKTQDNIYMGIKEENIQLNNELKSVDDELKKCKDKFEHVEEEEHTEENERMIKEQKKEIQKLKDRIATLKDTKEKPGIGKVALEELRKSKDDLSSQVARKLEKIKNLESEFEAINGSKDSEIQSLRERLQKCI